MDRTTKIIGIVGGLVILCLCICIVGAVGMRMAGPLMQQMATMTEDPQEVAQIAKGMVDYQLPHGYHEQFGMSVFGFDMVGFTPDSGSQVIMLMQFPEALGLSRADMEQQMEQSLQQQTGQEDIQMHVVEELDTTIRDQRVTMTVREGTNPDGTVFRQMSGVFEGKNGVVLLMIMAEKQHWDQRAVNAFFVSLR